MKWINRIVSITKKHFYDKKPIIGGNPKNKFPIQQQMMATGHYGGGFLPQDSHFNADQSHGMQSPSKLKSNENSTRPVTIKQILDAEVTPQDITIAIDGIATNEITIVGCITNVKSLETSKLFSLDDGTGSVEAKLWNPTEEYSSFREGIWVRVFGIIKPFNNAKQITITKMRQIVEFNEVTFHNLAVIEAHLMLTRGVASRELLIKRSKEIILTTQIRPLLLTNHLEMANFPLHPLLPLVEM